MFRYFSLGQLTLKWQSQDPDPRVSDPVVKLLTTNPHCLVVRRKANKSGPLPSAQQCTDYYGPVHREEG